MSESGSPSHLRLYGLLALMVLFWSGNFIVAKWAILEIPVLMVSGLRVALAGVMILPFYFWNARRTGDSGLDRKHLPLLVALGVVGVALNQFFFVLGLGRTSVAHSAIIIGMTPILVLLLAASRGLEKITARKVAGMLVAVIGVGILNWTGARPAQGGTSILGDVFVLLAATMFALFTVFGKEVTHRHSPITVTTFAYVGGAVALAPLTVWSSIGFSFAHVSLNGWACLFYMAAFPSIACYLIYYYALGFIPASRVSALSYFQPLLATLMAIPALGETVGGQVMAGGGIIFAGVWLTERG